MASNIDASQYYHEDTTNYGCYFSDSGASGASGLVFDYTKNKMMIYFKVSGTWKKASEVPIEIVQNDTAINVVVNGESYTITTKAQKIITKNTDGSERAYIYIENEKLCYNQNGVVEGAEIILLPQTKFINALALPTE